MKEMITKHKSKDWPLSVVIAIVVLIMLVLFLFAPEL